MDYSRLVVIIYALFRLDGAKIQLFPDIPVISAEFLAHQGGKRMKREKNYG